MNHIFYDREDGLAHCKVCGGKEGSLPRGCPGRRMTADEQDMVYEGRLDFRRGHWMKLLPEFYHGTGLLSYPMEPLHVTDDFGNAVMLKAYETLTQWLYSISMGKDSTGNVTYERPEPFDLTRLALANYECTLPERARAWDMIETNADVDAATLADHEAENKVRVAFYYDTRDINSLDNCMRVDMVFIRRIAIGNRNKF